MTDAGSTESHYASDPRVPPARVGHLGKHHRVPMGVEVDGARSAARQRDYDRNRDDGRHRDDDPGPSYDDFLEHDADEVG